MATLVSAPILRLRSGPLAGKVYEIRNALRIGRHPYNEVSLEDPSLSRYHCWITVQQDGLVFIEDLASANGTFVGEERIASRHPLRPGMVVRVGTTEIVFTEDAA
jgi:pSer/pThr/pTyr-binding forkhead associated (FHA) protein